MAKVKPLPVPPRNKYKTPLAVLKAAAKLLSSRKNWVQGELAVNCKGERCKPRSKRVIGVCALGAVRLVDGPAQQDAETILMHAALTYDQRLSDARRDAVDNQEDAQEENIFNVNDEDIDVERSYLNVKKMFRRAIQFARERNFLKNIEREYEKKYPD